MNRYSALMQRLGRGERILLDGATGTEIERRGVPMVMNAWNGGGALTHPDIVRQVHEDYIRLGAEIIITNTFSTARHVLEDAGMQQHFAFLNRRGVELACEARDRLSADSVLVAGGITTLIFTGRDVPSAELRRNYTDQARIMADTGADFIMLEMMMDIPQTRIALDAARAAGLPVWVGFTCEIMPDGTVHLRGGPPLVDALDAFANDDIPLINIMHTEVSYIDACLDVLQTRYSGPIGVYAHSGTFVGPNWVFTDTISPAAYAAAARGWLERGVQVIGGCCGIGTEHIAELRHLI